METIVLLDARELVNGNAIQSVDDLFQRIVERHGRWVFAAAYRQLRDRHRAEDAAQMVFCLLFQRIRTMEPDAKLSAWLFATLRLTVRNMRRAQRRRRFHEFHATAAWIRRITAAAPSSKNVADKIDDAVAALNGRNRTAILLRYYENLSFAEMGEALGISEAAARKRAVRAIAALRRKLGTASGTIAAALSYGRIQSPPELMRNLLTAGKTTGALPVVLSPAAQGMVALMALNKIQLTAVMIGAALLIGVSTTAIVRHWGSHKEADVAPAIPETTQASDRTEPADFRELYSLKPGQFMKHVNAPAQARADIYHAVHRISIPSENDPRPLDVFPELNGPMVIGWEGENPKLFGLFPNSDAISLQIFILTDMREFAQDVEGNAKDISIPGDFVFQAGGTPEDYRRGLEEVLQKDLKRHITISYRDVMRDVIVLRGTWDYHPAPAVVPPQSIPVIQFYGTHLNKTPFMGPMGSAPNNKELAGWIGSWLNESVLIEATGVPARIDWQGNLEDDPLNKAHDKALVLTHIKEQTGLTWSEESRTVRHVFVEESK